MSLVVEKSGLFVGHALVTLETENGLTPMLVLVKNDGETEMERLVTSSEPPTDYINQRVAKLDDTYCGYAFISDSTLHSENGETDVIVINVHEFNGGKEDLLKLVVLYRNSSHPSGFAVGDLIPLNEDLTLVVKPTEAQSSAMKCFLTGLMSHSKGAEIWSDFHLSPEQIRQKETTEEMLDILLGDEDGDDISPQKESKAGDLIFRVLFSPVTILVVIATGLVAGMKIIFKPITNARKRTIEDKFTSLGKGSDREILVEAVARTSFAIFQYIKTKEGKIYGNDASAFYKILHKDALGKLNKADVCGAFSVENWDAYISMSVKGELDVCKEKSEAKRWIDELCNHEEKEEYMNYLRSIASRLVREKGGFFGFGTQPDLEEARLSSEVIAMF